MTKTPKMTNMTGKLYVIGVGPGDPELLTLKAARILREVNVICVPKGREEGSSLALSIVKKALDVREKDIIEAHFPMKKTTAAEHGNELQSKWQNTVETVLNRLNQGQDMAFITLGDPSIYSTFFYLYDRLIELSPDLSIEIIPGVSSINASAAKAHISLGLADDKIAILPATYIDDIRNILENFDTVVLMKVHRVFDKIIKILEETKLINKAVYISRVSMDDERIFRDVTVVKDAGQDYFSMVIIRK